MIQLITNIVIFNKNRCIKSGKVLQPKLDLGQTEKTNTF